MTVTRLRDFGAKSITLWKSVACIMLATVMRKPYFHQKKAHEYYPGSTQGAPSALALPLF